MKLITLSAIKCMLKNEGIDKLYIDGGTIITKKACGFANENNIELLQKKESLINEKHLEATLHPEKYIATFINKVQR
ncbi:MAG: hypothetical protein RR071_09410 [Lachnospiraceae bacterium]